MSWVFIVHVAATCFMTGLCWFVQIVHYPLFRHIELEQFPRYERKNFVTAVVAVPAMTVELVSGLYLLYQDMSLVYVLNVGLLIAIGFSTMLFQVPIHLRLAKKATSQLIDKLILTNWIRTISWSARMVLLCILLLKHFQGQPLV